MSQTPAAVRSDEFVVDRVEPRSRARSLWGPVKESRAQAILEAIQRWNELYGEPPTHADWEPSRARAQGQGWRAERWERGDWPSTRAVRAQFGTMSAAIRAAGLAARSSPSRTRRHLVSPEGVLEAMRAWHARYGEPPAMTDWAPSRARQSGQYWRVARFYEGDWPSIATVRHHFGTLNQAVLAAGLDPRPPGRHALPKPHVKDQADSELHTGAQSMLALRVRSVAKAARSEQPSVLVEALRDLALTALSWADEVRTQTTDKAPDRERTDARLSAGRSALRAGS